MSDQTKIFLKWLPGTLLLTAIVPFAGPFFIPAIWRDRWQSGGYEAEYRKRRAAELSGLTRKRRQALAKLTDDEREALGLGR